MSLEEYINIDSRSRDKTIFSNSNYFTIQLSKPYKKVKSIELVSAEIPISYNNVISSNNQIIINENNNTNTNITINIAPNTYTLSSFATALQTALNAATISSYVYTVTYTSSTNSINITTTGTFRIVSATCARIIGFNGTTTNFSNTWTSTLACDIVLEKYILLKLNNIPFLSYNSNNNYFAKIHIPSASNTILYNGINNSYSQRKMIENDNFILNNINMELCFYDGSRVDLKGLDYSFTLLIHFHDY